MKSKNSARFRQLLEAAAKAIPFLWKRDGALNLTAVARYYRDKGHPMSQANLHRLYIGAQEPGEVAIEATHRVFRIPLYLLRGEQAPSNMEKLLMKYPLEVLLLAERIFELSPPARNSVLLQIETLLDQEERIREAASSGGNVTHLRRK